MLVNDADDNLTNLPRSTIFYFIVYSTRKNYGHCIFFCGQYRYKTIAIFFSFYQNFSWCFFHFRHKWSPNKTSKIFIMSLVYFRLIFFDCHYKMTSTKTKNQKLKPKQISMNEDYIQQLKTIDAFSVNDRSIDRLIEIFFINGSTN